MTVPENIRMWYICEECGEAESTENGFPERWMLQWFDNRWYVLCPCSYTKSVESIPEVDGSGYTRGGGTSTWNPSAPYTTTTNFTFDYYPPLKKKAPLQEKMDAVLAEIEEEKAEQERRWKAWEETKHSKHMDPCCERCVEEIERIKRELKDFGKGNKDEN
jgi:hypothetical protein